MRAKVTDQGVTLPKEWFSGVAEVDIQREDGRIVVAPVRADDPIMQLGSDPLPIELTDAAVNHDEYLYGS